MSCLDQLPKDIKNEFLASIFTRNYLFWIGSGFSRNFGYGSWGEVLEVVKEKLEYPLQLDISNPLKAAELLCSYSITHHEYNENEFNELVSEALAENKEEKKDPRWVRRFKAFAPNYIVTTNWDNVLETIFDNMPSVVIRKDKSPQISSSGTNILKIHGDASRPETIVVTQSQYFSFQREETYLNRKIYTLFSEASPIFIGYSLTDPNIGFLYEEVFAHLGSEKPPAYMIVHPSTNEEIYQEYRLLFENKNIYLIKASIDDFLKDLLEDYIEYKKTNNRFKKENERILDRLQIIMDHIEKGKAMKNEDILELFRDDARQQATNAIAEILSRPTLYKVFGKKLLSPEQRMPYHEMDRLIQSYVVINNEIKHKNPETRETFYSAVMKLCSRTDGIWDFNFAEIPFRNILRISPRPNSKYFEERIDHIIDILRWSHPNQIGKCWATWQAFKDHAHWINENDITEIIRSLTLRKRRRYTSNDKRWVQFLATSRNCSEEQKERLENIIKEYETN